MRPGSSARSDSSQLQQSPFGGVPAKEEEGWWNHDGRRQANLVSSSAEQDGSRVMSDEEVEEAEASDAFPALGYPRNLASVGVGSLCSGDFSDDMRRMGATGSDWSDWDAHLPASPTASNPVCSMGSSLNRTLSTQTSNKFEVAEGEDEELKQTMWVVEHLQEELIAADNARMAADEQVQARSHIVQELQLEIQDRVGILADLKEQIEEKHRQLEKQLLQQLDVQELLREREEEIRATVAETGIINQTIAEKDEEMAELKEQAAQQKLAQQSQAAASSSADASKGKAAGNAGDSPRSNMSSPWATDVSESEDDEESGASSPSKTTPLSRLTPPSRPGSAQKAAAPAAPEAAGFGPTWLRGVLGTAKKTEKQPEKGGEVAAGLANGKEKCDKDAPVVSALPSAALESPTAS
ncbi:hypothetical protein COCOBI_14-2150 [Coccomyxa sp. Obi]|nr:hypothetical protein COCOBI_14-2150 [Coccomyxa sp. Obi]